MAIPVYIVSGFLGSGKTTFIQTWISQMENSRHVMVIENDFGEVGFDSALLQKQGIRFEELASGCICCTLVGDFKKSLHKVLQNADTDCIIIEPSGVAKLSDIIAVCKDVEKSGAIALAEPITIVDGRQGYMYVENFGEFLSTRFGTAVISSSVTATKARLRRKRPSPPCGLKIRRPQFIANRGRTWICRRTCRVSALTRTIAPAATGAAAVITMTMITGMTTAPLQFFKRIRSIPARHGLLRPGRKGLVIFWRLQEIACCA